MLHNCPIVCFTATRNAELARSFYAEVLGLPLIEDGPFALVFDAHGTMLRVQKYADHVPLRSTTLGWKVTDIASKLGELASRGVRFERYPEMAQDALGVWRSPSGAQVAWFKDPDGNTLSLTQFAG